MKTKFFFFTALLLLLGGCGVSAPPYAATDETWVVGNQTWSAAIEIPGCNKTDYDGGDWDNPKADCRNNPGYAGYLYSWNYVRDNAAALCPSPWRVPTKDDFENLDIALGGTGSYRENVAETWITTNYVSRLGGAYGGDCSSGGALYNQGSYAQYWSSSERSATDGYEMLFGTYGDISPQYYAFKYYGHTLRCVR